MSTLLFTICTAQRCSSALFNDHHHHLQCLNNAQHRALVARAAAATARLRRRRADRAPVTPLQKRRRSHGFQSLQRLLQRRLDNMASAHEIRRRSSAADRAVPAPSLLATTSSATTTTFASGPDALGLCHHPEPEGTSKTDAEAMPPPPTPPPTTTADAAAADAPAPDASPSRLSRSTSTASRNANRLSLTLPIAPPSGDPSRPTPTYASHPSLPPTPAVDRPVSAASPASADEFIIAIAAQERRVLELREELSRAESELSTLKKRWSTQEVTSRRVDGRRSGIDSPRAATTPTDAESPAPRPGSVDFDRRRLLRQQQLQDPPTPNRRRVIRGGHARTLSLLSPAKSDSGFAVHQDTDNEPLSLPPPPVQRRTDNLAHPNLPKRSSWHPQHYRHQSSVPGIVEDFRLGLQSFVEDIRQITVGDEPITGSSPLGRSPGHQRSVTESPKVAGDLETIRASHNGARPKVSTAFDQPASGASTPTPSSKTPDGTPREKNKPGRSKHFSWTPLSFDSLDDNAWSSWESPGPVKSTRWSGSTINSAGGEDIQSIPEEADEPSKPTLATNGNTSFSPKLGEILPNMVNRLSPTNIKRTANHLMDEWERSLVEPEPVNDKENRVENEVPTA